MPITKGPWIIVYGHTDALPIASESTGLIVARVELPKESAPIEWEDNANAIAGVPTLLEFVEWCANLRMGGADWDSFGETLREEALSVLAIVKGDED